MPTIDSYQVSNLSPTPVGSFTGIPANVPKGALNQPSDTSQQEILNVQPVMLVDSAGIPKEDRPGTR